MPNPRLSADKVQLILYNHHLGKSVQELAEIFSVCRKTIYNVLNRVNSEGRSEPNRGGGQKKKISDRMERHIMRKIDQNPKLSTRTLAKELQEDCGVEVSHETVRKTIMQNKYFSRSARKKPLLSSANIEKRLSFALKHVSEPRTFWEDVIFCDETKMMLYYNDGPSRVWRKALTALENKNIIPTVKFGKMSVMIWGCFSSKGMGDIAFIENTMNADQYLSILKSKLKSSAMKFGFIQNNKPVFKFYQDNDPKHKEHRVRTWLLYNCGKVLDTPAQSPDLNPIENLWAYLKKKVGKRQPKNMTALKSAIQEEWNNIPANYDLQKLVHSMTTRLQCVVNAKGAHTKY